MDIDRLRALFPVTGRAAYLDNAAESPVNLLVRRRLDEYLDLVSASPRAKPSVRLETKALLARLLGGSPEDYALVASTGVGLGMAAAGIAWKAGDNVVLPADEHWNNSFPWFALRGRGVEVRLVMPDAEGRVTPEAVAARVDGRTRVVAMAAVRHATGFRADLKAMSRIARGAGALFAVDAIQAAGVAPLDVEADGIDIMSAAAFKWLLGQPGTGFLYVSPAARERVAPLIPGMFAAEDSLRELRCFPDSRRYETGTIAYPFYYAWAAGLELLLELGVDAIRARSLELTSRLAAGIRGAGMELHSPMAREAERSSILSFSAGSADANKALVARLEESGILISYRGGSCRVSPNFFNTEEELRRFAASL